MTTPLHDALGLTGSDLTFALIAEACERSVAETERLDWKSEVPLPTDSTKGDEARARSLELAKDVAAMANGRGGLIVCGVRERGDNEAGELVDVGDHSNGVQARRIRQVAASMIYPPADLTVHLLQNDDGTIHLLVIEIPESSEAPHLVQPKRDGGNDGWLMAPYRSGPDTYNMVERQLEAAYRQRLEGRRQRERSLRELHAELTERYVVGDRQESGAVVILAQPLTPRRGRLPDDPGRFALGIINDAASTAQMLVHMTQQLFYFPVVLLGEVHSNRRSLRRHVFTADRPSQDGQGGTVGPPAELTIELHDDGTLGVVWSRGAAFPHVRATGIAPTMPALDQSDPDSLATLIVAIVTELCDRLQMTTDYQLRVTVEPHRPVHVITSEGHLRRDKPAPSPAPLETELRLSASVDTRAGDIVALGEDMNSMLELAASELERLTDYEARGSRMINPQTAAGYLRRIFGGDPTETPSS
ncbi:AlbA family DNA-binding domain-containing protein [Nocardioides zeae]